MNKRTLVIVGIATLILILGGISAYFYFSKKSPSMEEGVPRFPNIGNVTSIPRQDGEETRENFTPGSGAKLPRLWELHKTPVAGIGFVETGTKTNRSVFVRYIERSVGHIFETNLGTFVENRISNDTHPGISEAFFGNKGSSVVIRFLDSEDNTTIKTRVQNIKAPSVSFDQTSSDSESAPLLATEEVYLPDYIPHIAIAEDGTDKLFYLENSTSAARGTTANTKGLGTSVVFNSVFTEWLPQFPSQKLITLTTKPSGDVPGYFFFLDPKTKTLSRVLGNINGLTTLTNHGGNLVLYSDTKTKEPVLSFYNTAKKEFRTTPFKTLPEKCVWGNLTVTIAYCAVPEQISTGLYPDQWYQGLISFSDSIWKIDTKTGVVEKVFTPKTFNSPEMDVVNLALSSDDTYLVFINKKSSTPWVFNLIKAAGDTGIPPVETRSSIPNIF